MILCWILKRFKINLKNESMSEKKHWTVLRSKKLLDTPWLKVEEQECQLASGNVISPFYLIHQPSWVLILASDTEGQIPMVKQYRHGTQKVYLEFPAGNLESDENPIDCAKRELLEETGFGGGEWELGRQFPVNPDRNSSWCQIVLAKGVQQIRKSLTLDETEELQSLHVSPQDLQSKITQHSTHIPALHELAWLLYSSKFL